MGYNSSPLPASSLERPRSSSNAPSSLPIASASRQRSLNDLSFRNWTSTSGLSSDVSDSHVEDIDESDDFTSLPQIPDSFPQSSIYEPISCEPARSTARHSFSNLLSSIEDFRHAAGRKLKNKKSFARRHASAIQEEEEEDLSNSSAATTWLKHKNAPSQRNRRPSDQAMLVQRNSRPSQPRLQTSIQSSPAAPQKLSPSGGEGARAAAAMARLGEKGRELDDSCHSLSPISPELGRSLRRMSSISSDNESGIEFDIRNTSDDMLVSESVISRQDPASLPTEIFTKVLSFLDSETLMHAALVSKRWNEVASSRHVWKYAFNREFTEPARAASGLTRGVPGGGFGLGIKHGYQPWRKMWQIRKQLDQRWKNGHAAAIYLVGHHDSVYCVQFDEDRIITGSRDWTVRIWNARTFQCTHILGIPKEVNTTHHPLSARKKQGKQPVHSHFPPAPEQDPIQVKSEERHTGSVLCIDYDKDMMVTGSSDCTVIVWSTAGGQYKALRQLRIHTMGVLDVRLNERYIIACSKDTTVSVWDRKTLSLVRVLNGHRGPVNAVQLRGNFVVSASGDGVAKLWNLTTGLCVKEFHPPGDENVGRSRGLACVEFTHDARTIFAGGNDKKVYQFDTASGNMVRTFKGHESLVRSLHYDAANGRIVTGSYDHAVWAYDFETGEPICNFKNWTTSWMLSARADYRRIVAASQDGKAIVMDFGWQLPGVELLEGLNRNC